MTLSPTSSAPRRVRIGLVGFGLGGRIFHAPFITNCERTELVGIVVNNPERQADARAEYPEAQIVPDLDALLDCGVDAVVISTPPATHRDLVIQAAQAGVHVLVDKPFALTVAEAEEMTAAAQQSGVQLTVFHNRRWDPDLVTALAVLSSGQLGEVTRAEIRLDSPKASYERLAAQSGVLRDLGSHLVDQAVQLCGPITSVYAQLTYVDAPSADAAAAPADAPHADPTGGAVRVDSGFALALTHANGQHSLLTSRKMPGEQDREMRIFSRTGAYISRYSDVQEVALRAGERPTPGSTTWGVEHRERWGTLITVEKGELCEQRIPSLQGDYTLLYDAFAAAILDGAPNPVPPAQALHVLAVLEAARESDRTGQAVTVETHRG